MVQILFLCSGNYYRSRFAEILFNHVADQRGLEARAESAGLEPECHSRNPGPISRNTLAALAVRRIPVPSPRLPRDVNGQDFLRADIIIAVKESEHRPMMRSRFPEWEPRTRYWDVNDVEDEVAATALVRLEGYVLDLIEEVSQRSQRRPAQTG